MTTSLTRSQTFVLPSDGKPTEQQVAYFGRRLRNQLHGEVLKRFLEEKRANQLTKAELARRMNRDPAQINRWLAAPKNVEIETFSHLLLAMGYVPKVSSAKLTDLSRTNYFDTNDSLDRDAGTNEVKVKTKFDAPVALSA